MTRKCFFHNKLTDQKEMFCIKILITVEKPAILSPKLMVGVCSDLLVSCVHMCVYVCHTSVSLLIELDSEALRSSGFQTNLLLRCINILSSTFNLQLKQCLQYGTYILGKVFCSIIHQSKIYYTYVYKNIKLRRFSQNNYRHGKECLLSILVVCDVQAVFYYNYHLTYFI